MTVLLIQIIPNMVLLALNEHASLLSDVGVAVAPIIFSWRGIIKRPPNAIAPVRLAQTATRFLTGLVILLCSSNGYGTDASDGAGDAAGNSGESTLEQAGFMRFLDRQSMLESGVDLPGQWGAAAFFNQSKSKLPVENLQYGFSEDEPLQSNPLVTMDDLDNEITNSGIILDYWILPMLDIYTILGHSDGEMDSTVNTFTDTQPLGFNFTGTSYAAGATLVMGYKQAILMLDYNYMELDTDVYEEKIPVSNSTIRLGWILGEKKWLPKVAWVSYIDTEFEGTFDLKQIVGQGVDSDSVPPGTTEVLLSFEVEKYDTWALGAQWSLNKNLQLISEIGLDTVKGVTLALNYRWESI
jgi:hypothetical protein